MKKFEELEKKVSDAQCKLEAAIMELENAKLQARLEVIKIGSVDQLIDMLDSASVHIVPYFVDGNTAVFAGFVPDEAMAEDIESGKISPDIRVIRVGSVCFGTAFGEKAIQYMEDHTHRV